MRIITGLMVVGILPASMTDADGPALSASVESADRKYLLVMHSPMTLEEELAVCPASRDAEIRRLRSRYSHGGLYRNDGSSEPIWRSHLHCDPARVLVADDGRHCVQTWPIASEVHATGVTLLRDGREIKSWPVRDFIDSDIVPSGTDSTGFVWLESAQLDAGQNGATIRTNRGEDYFIEFEHPKVCSLWTNHPIRWWLTVCTGVMFAGAAFLWGELHVRLRSFSIIFLIAAVLWIASTIAFLMASSELPFGHSSMSRKGIHCVLAISVVGFLIRLCLRERDDAPTESEKKA